MFEPGVLLVWGVPLLVIVLALFVVIGIATREWKTSALLVSIALVGTVLVIAGVELWTNLVIEWGLLG